MDIKKYIFGHCVSPKHVKIWDAYSRSFVVRELPCGECLHCKNTRVNEWVTRLYAEMLNNKHSYFITLDYKPFSYDKDSFSDPTAYKLAVDTAACWHNLNTHKIYGMQPLLLRKEHLQKFFKRLRKNYGVSFKYFACGEYGTKAGGHGFGRPHFHIVLFSQQPITFDMVVDAWTLNGYSIGRVDYNDLVANGTTNEINSQNKLNSKFVFKYVCKYLQKGDFDFEKLYTINHHRAYFKSLHEHYKVLYRVLSLHNACPDSLFPRWCIDSDIPESEYTWKQYCSDYSPFTCCSKRTSIGYEYFQQHASRFTQGDFRLFGLSKECTAFPRYFLRKAKELACPLVAIGAISGQPSSSSRLSAISSILSQIYESRLGQSLTESFTSLPWRCVDEDGHKFIHIDSGDTKKDRLIPLSFFHLYDTSTRIFFQFNGYNYSLWQKVPKFGYVHISDYTLYDAIQFINGNFRPLYEHFIRPFHDSRVLTEKELVDTINIHYKGDCYEERLQKFREDVYVSYKTELAHMRDHNLITNNSNITL